MILKKSTDKNRLERMFHIEDAVSVVNFQGSPEWFTGILEEQIGPPIFRLWLEDGCLWKRYVHHICMNIPTEPIVRGSEESSQPLRSQGQTFKGHSTSVTQLPAPNRDGSLSTTGASLGDDHPRTHIRTCLLKCKEDERRNNAKGKTKRQHPSIELDSKGKRHSARLLAKEIGAKESLEDTDTDDSVVVDNHVTMSESWVPLPSSDGNSCQSSIEKPMDTFKSH